MRTYDCTFDVGMVWLEFHCEHFARACVFVSQIFCLVISPPIMSRSNRKLERMIVEALTVNARVLERIVENQTILRGRSYRKHDDDESRCSTNRVCLRSRSAIRNANADDTLGRRRVVYTPENNDDSYALEPEYMRNIEERFQKLIEDSMKNIRNDANIEG